MLINLSNHPSDSWPSEQIETALKSFKKVYDIPFPLITNEVGQEQMNRMVHEYSDQCENIIHKNKNEPCAVHIMGEMVFTTALVYLLLKKNISCLASYSMREAEQEGELKISVFKFMGFREYFLP